MTLAVEQAAKALAGRERPFDVRARYDGTVACVECGDCGWVEVPIHATLTVRPCRCQGASFDRWAAGYPKRDGDRRYEAELRPREPAAPVRQEQF